MAFEPIAIVGRACVLPGALNPAQLWELVLAGRDMTSSADPGRWGLPLADVHGEGPDRTWHDRGGYVRGFESVWDPQGFALPANELDGLDPLFLWVLHCAREALADAGDTRRGAVSRPAVAALFGNLGFPTAKMSALAESRWFGDTDTNTAVDPRNRFMGAGAAALLERALGLAPGVYGLDTACASSLVAIKLACDQLHDRRADMVLAGAVNRADDLFLHVGFSALSALSPSGRSRPFHAEADGLLPAEGAGFVALERLSDARKHGRHIYGLIRGVGLSNDGRARGFLAPSQSGQVRALRQAYALADIPPSEVELLECHATGTSVGDSVELRSSAEVLADGRAPGDKLAIGSLKSNFGHAITAAGIAGLIKVLEAMHHGQRPPTLHADHENPALAETPFRLLHAAEPWPARASGPRVAAISAFGFGGNNAHVVVSGDDPNLAEPTPTPVPAGSVPLAIVGIGAVVGEASDSEAFTQALLGEVAATRQTLAAELDLGGVRFPPKDLEQTLAQQLLVLRAAREAMAETPFDPTLSSARCGVFMGIEPDAEICRHGARWRLDARRRRLALPGEAEPELRDRIVGPLHAAGVVGTMPNIPANRLNAQFDFGGHSCTVFAGEASGRRALELASRALREHELDAAIVGASDLSCEPVHAYALAASEAPAAARDPGDAASVLVLRRLADARAAGERILAVLEPDGSARASKGPRLRDHALDARFGRSFAAGDLRDIAAAVLTGRRGALPNGRSWAGAQAMQLDPPPGGETNLLTPHRAAPQLLVFAGATKAALVHDLELARPGGEGPCRATIVAGNPRERATRIQRALLHLQQGSPTGPGVFVRLAPIGGDLALVFNGAGAAYEGMARPLLDSLPALGRELAEQCPELAASFGQPWSEVAPLQKLWASSFVSQLHARLSQNLLGLRPQAVIGYSSGESNSLFASGIWSDHDAMVRACRESGVFTREIGGELRAVARAWGRPPEQTSWETWTVLAPIPTIEAAIAHEAGVHLSIIHTDNEGVIGGDAEGIARVRATLGEQHCMRLHYDLAVHVPELAEVRETWLELHRRPVQARADLRVYSGAHAGAYAVSEEACAQAILAQADRRLDFRAVVEQAYQDGVRVFVEHGPRGACSRWIREILGERDAVVVALDRRGGGLEVVVEAAAALIAAGVPCQIDGLAPSSAPSPNSTASKRPAFALRFDAHPPHLELELVPATLEPEPAPLRPTASFPMSADIQIMPPAPMLPAIGTPVPALAAPAAIQHGAPPPLQAMPTAPSNLPPAAPAQTPGTPFAATIQAQIADLGHQQRLFINQQTQLHQQFLSVHEHSMALLASAARGQGVQAPQAPQARWQPQSAPMAPQTPQVAPVTHAAPVMSPPPAIPERPVPAARPSPAEAKPALQKPAPSPKPTPRTASTASAASTEAPQTGPRAPVGPTFDRAALEVHAGGNISTIFGPAFAGQDSFERQVRMPEPPLLLADRVTGLDAEPMSMKLGTIWTETDVKADAWYLHDGHMPAGIMIESGQADLMLISYLGVDAENKSDRVYRLLGCTLSYHGGLPHTGETLCYDIHLDGHAKQGDTRLMFFHYNCHIDGKPRLTVRKGQAGFFTDEELANSDGCIWTPEGQAIVEQPRLDPPALECTHSALTPKQLQAFSDGRPWDCFGDKSNPDDGWAWAKTHTRTPRIQAGSMLFFDRVDELSTRGGPWKRGYLHASIDITPDHWFFEGHFHNDQCMPGTLMLEGCLQTVAVYMASLGYTIKRDGWRFEPVQDEPFVLSCRGQVTPKAKLLTYEVFVEEVVAGPIPMVYADLLCTVDGLKAFHARRVGLRLVPAWPLDESHPLLEDPKALAAAGPVHTEGDFAFDYNSLLSCAQGRPSSAFGPVYERFDSHESVARLPNPPYHFISRIAAVEAELAGLRPGGRVDVEWDIPSTAWYLAENGNRTVPQAVLLEAALQPCGWLASYIGGALASSESLMFRNLDGTSTQHVELHETGGTLKTTVHSTSVSKTASMVIVGFRVECKLDEVLVYSMDTVFGFFPATAFDNQAGLPTTDTQRLALESPSTFVRELDGGQATPGRARMARPMLLMLDRVTAFDPEGGAAKLGTARAEKSVDRDEWFFKAHFFQDPVQPGSLGIEAMLQLLQWTMLEFGMDADMRAPRFEAIALDEPMTWKYRGQVVPTNRTISTTVEIVERGHDERGAYAKALASLWVDGKRIYEASNLGMRIVDDGNEALTAAGNGRTLVLDPDVDTWLRDHCPTHTLPSLPMMSMVDLLASATRADERLLGLRDVRVKGWVILDTATQFRIERNREQVELRVIEADGSERMVASGRIVVGRNYERRAPTPLPALNGPATPSPYASEELFNGPAFQLLTELVRTREGASSRLDLARSTSIPLGTLAPALLDAATHGIPHDALGKWSWPEGQSPSPGKVAYPAWIPELDIFGPTPQTGTLRCEARPVGILGSPDFPAIEIQLIHDHLSETGRPESRVWCRLRLIEACFPKGRLGSAPGPERRAFLRDHRAVPGLSLSETSPERSELKVADIEGSDWLPGTVAAIYGSRDPVRIAQKEHIGAAQGLHPRHLPEALPLTRFALETTQSEDAVTVTGAGAGEFDLSVVRNYWTSWFDRGSWPVEDLYYGLIERFVGRVVVEDPPALAKYRGKGIIFVANHQVAVESLLFSVIASALTNLPTVTLAKIEHKTTWLGKLIALSFTYPEIRDPGLIAFFDRNDKSSLRPLIASLGQQVQSATRSMMVHVEGTRALSCQQPVVKMSGAFLDLAIAIGAPVVPVRFSGALPVEALEKRIEFPLNMGKQDIWFGRPIEPQELNKYPYGERRDRVVAAINGLGPANADETPLPGDPAFATAAEAWAAQRGIDHDHATLHQVLAQLDAPGDQVKRLLSASTASELAKDDSPEGRWLAELGRRLLG